MKPPFEITNEILKLISSISEKLGEINVAHLYKPPTKLRKENRIKTIQSSLEIEGNTLTTDQITALLENKRVIAPAKDIQEVQNAIEVYNNIGNYKFTSVVSFLKAHRTLMKGLTKDAGKYRTSGVGIVQGSKVSHVAPRGTLVNGLMRDLFSYLKVSDDLILVKSCVFHYELEFIHPFSDGNGRMGRLWQQVILMHYHQVFEFLSVESLIKERQKEYYKVLGESDKTGQSTPFIKFMLENIDQSLSELLNSANITLNGPERVEVYKGIIGSKEFTRKEYLRNFKDISSATASRDLKEAVVQGVLEKSGDKRTASYQFK